MKILIVGDDLNALLLAKYVNTQSREHDIYITTDIESEDKSFTPIGIKENDINSICDFVKYNQIEFTIVTSSIAIINGIADLFIKEGFPILAPTSEAARVTFFNSIAKKVMYKLKIPTQRFGIFDRENIALEYIRRAKFPITIMNDFTVPDRKYIHCKSYQKAKLALQKIFEIENTKIVVENYLDSNPIYVYFLTDGYNALPLISIEKKEEELFKQIIAPSNRVTDILAGNLLKYAIYPLLDDIAKNDGVYSGILGLKIKLKDSNFYVLEYYNGFQDYDMQVFLSLCSENIVDLLQDAAEKQLGKRYFIELQDKYSYTLAVNRSEITADIDEDDYFITENNKDIIITKTASTMNFAKQDLEDFIESICSEKTFEEIKNKTKEELRI